jgi:hypothetical protein
MLLESERRLVVEVEPRKWITFYAAMLESSTCIVVSQLVKIR